MWSKMRTMAWETASRIVLRNCSKEVGRVSIDVILVKREESMQSNIYLQEVSASHEEQTSPRRILVLF